MSNSIRRLDEMDTLNPDIVAQSVQSSPPSAALARFSISAPQIERIAPRSKIASVSQLNFRINDQQPSTFSYLATQEYPDVSLSTSSLVVTERSDDFEEPNESSAKLLTQNTQSSSSIPKIAVSPVIVSRYMGHSHHNQSNSVIERTELAVVSRQDQEQQSRTPVSRPKRTKAHFRTKSLNARAGSIAAAQQSQQTVKYPTTLAVKPTLNLHRNRSKSLDAAIADCYKKIKELQDINNRVKRARTISSSIPRTLTLTLKFKHPLPSLSLSASTQLNRSRLTRREFRAFPLEIASMIFKLALRSTWNGSTKSLIQALRGSRSCQDLYQEAIRSFYKTNRYMLNRANGWSFGDMDEKVLAKIEAIGVDFGNPMLRVHWPKLMSTFTNPGTVDAIRGMQFHTFHLTDLTYRPREERFWAADDQAHRNNRLLRLLQGTILPRHGNSIRHIILNTYLMVDSIYTYRDTVLLLNKLLKRKARLARVDTRIECVWFWDLKAMDGDSWCLPKDMIFWEDEIKMWQID